MKSDAERRCDKRQRATTSYPQTQARQCWPIFWQKTSPILDTNRSYSWWLPMQSQHTFGETLGINRAVTIALAFSLFPRGD